MGGKLLKLTVSPAVLAVGLVTIFCNSNVNASEPSVCYDKNSVEIIYVRGSGEGYGGEFYQAINPALKNNITEARYSIKELTPSLVDEQTEPYAAVTVSEGFDGRYTSIAAVLSHGDFGKYKTSIESGKALLEKFLKQLSNDPDECVVLLGYSQGAQVIGDTLTSVASEYPGLLSRIIYVGLFGDPKLDLRGEGLSLGRDIPWYRGDAIPVINGGSLGSRIPYVPKFNDVYMGPVGSWCYEDDFVCTENYMAVPSISAHGKYPERSFSQMSLEVANAVNASLGDPNQVAINNPTCRQGGQDVVVLLDTSPTMRRDSNLFSSSAMNDPFHATPSGLKLPPRTAGQMLVGAGCENTRIAVVGYGRPSDGDPEILLNFTNDARAYDSLMHSLYKAETTGVHERTQFREGALKAMDLSWRPGASRTIYTITNSSGSGPEWGSGSSGSAQAKIAAYKKDQLTQQVVGVAREKDVMIIGHALRSSYDGFTWSQSDDPGDYRGYLNMFATLTGGYNWTREWASYGGYSYKQTRLAATLDEAYERREGLTATAITSSLKVSNSSVLRVVDTANQIKAASTRGESISYRWQIDCGDKSFAQYTVLPEITFTPLLPGKCIGTVVVETKRNTGGGCYAGCPEPFPPRYVKALPLALDVKPAEYAPDIPGHIQDFKKVIYANHVEYEWKPPENFDDEKLVYVFREQDGFVLGATTAQQLVITDTNHEDPLVFITVHNQEGKSPSRSSDDAQSIDMRIEPAPLIELPYISPKEPDSINMSDGSTSTDHDRSQLDDNGFTSSDSLGQNTEEEVRSITAATANTETYTDSESVTMNTRADTEGDAHVLSSNASQPSDAILSQRPLTAKHPAGDETINFRVFYITAAVITATIIFPFLIKRHQKNT